MPKLIDHSFLQHRLLGINTKIKSLEHRKMECRESELKLVELSLVKQKGRLAEVLELIDHILKQP